MVLFSPALLFQFWSASPVESAAVVLVQGRYFPRGGVAAFFLISFSYRLRNQHTHMHVRYIKVNLEPILLHLLLRLISAAAAPTSTFLSFPIRFFFRLLITRDLSVPSPVHLSHCCNALDKSSAFASSIRSLSFTQLLNIDCTDTTSRAHVPSAVSYDWTNQKSSPLKCVWTKHWASGFSFCVHCLRCFPTEVLPQQSIK